MTVQEFSLEFDLQYGNVMSNAAPGLNEYEKSLFLTQAQEQTVMSLYAGGDQLSFEATEFNREMLSALVRTETVTDVGEGTPLERGTLYRLTLPDDVWFKTLELAGVSDGSAACGGSERTAEVVPVTQDGLVRAARSPFRGAGRRRVLRLDSGLKEVELFSTLPLVSYTVRYLARPEPIVLADLPEGLTVNGVSKARTCTLSDAVHRTVLGLAVQLARAAWLSTQAQMTAEQQRQSQPES